MIGLTNAVGSIDVTAGAKLAEDVKSIFAAVDTAREGIDKVTVAMESMQFVASNMDVSIGQSLRVGLESIYSALEVGQDLNTNQAASAAGLDTVRYVADTLAYMDDAISALEAGAGAKLQKSVEDIYGALQTAARGGDPSVANMGFIKVAAALDFMSDALAGIDEDAGTKLTKSIDGIYTALAIAAQGGEEAGANVAKVTPVVKALEKFTGGEIRVVSELPEKFDINVQVDIDSKLLGRAIAARNLSYGSPKKYMSTNPTKSI